MDVGRWWEDGGDKGASEWRSEENRLELRVKWMRILDLHEDKVEACGRGGVRFGQVQVHVIIEVWYRCCDDSFIRGLKYYDNNDEDSNLFNQLGCHQYLLPPSQALCCKVSSTNDRLEMR